MPETQFKEVSMPSSKLEPFSICRSSEKEEVFSLLIDMLGCCPIFKYNQVINIVEVGS